jgi:hypothetical protein
MGYTPTCGLDVGLFRLGYLPPLIIVSVEGAVLIPVLDPVHCPVEGVVKRGVSVPV